MANQRQKFNMPDHEHKILIQLYLDMCIPIDQFEGRPEQSSEFLRRWNHMTKRTDTIGWLVWYMRNQRKNGKWVKLGQNAMEVPKLPRITAENQEKLVKIYYKLFASNTIGCDEIFYNEGFIKALTAEYAKQANEFQSGSVLVSYLTKLRKRGFLPAVEKQVPKEEFGFDDLDQAIG